MAKDTNKEFIDRMVIGNYHEKKEGSYIRYSNQTENLDKVKDIITQKVAAATNNNFLCSTLDAPNGVRDIFRLSRILFKDNQHLILVGPASD